MMGRYPLHRYLPHIGDLNVITTTWCDLNTQSSDRTMTTAATTTTITTMTTNSSPLTLQPLYHRTTLLPDLHRQLQGKWTRLTSTSAPDITTATGCTFITYQSSKRRFLNDRVRASACFLASSSHNAGRDTTTSAWLRYLPSSLTDDCLLAPIWDDAGTTRHATPRRRTPTTNFQHLWHQTLINGSRNKSQAPLSQHTATRLPDNPDLTFEPLYASKCSIYPNHAFRSSYPLPRRLPSTPKKQSPWGGDMGNAHIAVLPRAPARSPTPTRGIAAEVASAGR
jgi:hypothetical protein